MTDTSWKRVGKWYGKLTEGGGHYYHKHVVIPGVLRLLDLACGSGVLARAISPSIEYIGIDLAPNLVETAKKQDNNPHHTYIVSDVTKPLSLSGTFSQATVLLALQNMEHPEGAIANAGRLLEDRGTLVIVLNHPAFRIPRQSSWGIDESNKMQYRKVMRYLNPMEIPITTHPGQPKSPVTWSYHHPLSDYSKMLADAGFVIELLEEWVSDKTSEGTAKKQENRARSEFPLFLALKTRKCML